MDNSTTPSSANPQQPAPAVPQPPQPQSPPAPPSPPPPPSPLPPVQPVQSAQTQQAQQSAYAPPQYAPPAGAAGQQMPPAGMPAAGATGQPPPPPKPSKPANFRLGALLPPMIRVKVPPHQLKFDEQYFLHLLAGSISLTRDEKTRIVESIPKLKQSQIDELIRIFEEERRKFAELGEEHVPQLEKLAKQHYEDWVDIETKQEQSSKAQEDAQKAEEIRKQLGL